MKLQSIIYSAGILAVAMSSCTSDETVMKPETQVGEINFSVSTPNMTRAASNFTSAAKPKRFKVWAFDGSQNYFAKDEDNLDNYTGDIIYTEDGGSTWKSEKKEYWPTGKPSSWQGLDFYAYVDDSDIDYSGENAGEESAGTFDAMNKQFVNYTVSENISEQRDLLYAVKRGVKPDYEGGSVNFHFYHALSQICFKAQNNNPWYKNLKVTGITWHNIANKGTFTLPLTSTSSENKGTWSYDHHLMTDCSLSFPEGISVPSPVKNTETNEFEGEVMNISVPTSKKEAAEGTEAEEAFHGYAMNLIPQKVGEGVLITVKFTTDFFDEEKEITLPLAIDWQPDCRYIYTLKFKDTVEVEMSFAPRFDDWIPEEEEIQDKIDYTTIGCNGYETVRMRNYKAATDNSPEVPALYVASHNIGASKPDELGLVFGFGDVIGEPTNTDGYRWQIDSSHSAHTPSYNYIKSLMDSGYFTNKNRSWTDPTGYDDEEYNLFDMPLVLDAAHIQWGGNWEMPTIEDFEWLLDSKNVEWRYCDGDIRTEISWSDGTSTKKYNYEGSFAKSLETGSIIFFVHYDDWDVSYMGKTVTECFENLCLHGERTNRFTTISSDCGRYGQCPIRPVIHGYKAAE